jgi:hypothetical protein
VRAGVLLALLRVRPRRWGELHQAGLVRRGALAAANRLLALGCRVLHTPEGLALAGDAGEEGTPR